MSLREYGGYLPIELPDGKGEHYQSQSGYDVIAVNSGRSAFQLAALSLKATRMFVPHFTCSETEEPFKAVGMRVEKYFLDEKLLPADVKLGSGDAMLWTNYYGNAGSNEIKEVVNRYPGKLIIDNCHAFFAEPITEALNCYSTRKFFGVSDGGYLVGKSITPSVELSETVSFPSIAHLAIQTDLGTNEGYAAHQLNESRLAAEFGLMSRFTRRILGSIDYQSVLIKRRRNLELMHSLLGSINSFHLNLQSNTHMYYPFLHTDEGLRGRLLESRIYTPYWWRHVLANVPENSIENRLSRLTVLLPIDQRYSESDIRHISEMVIKLLSRNPDGE
jgi:dTDP-4-amino-4,6-dideoxygalactose transaminase